MGLPNQDTTSIVTNNGLRTQYGVILSPGANVAAYVRSTGVQAGDDEFLDSNLCSTLAQGMARCRAGLGDFVVVLPGHVETVNDATTFSGALVAGTKILGVGRGASMPTFTFTGNPSTWAVNKADVTISGIRIQCGTVGVTNGITVTAANFGFYNNVVDPGNGTAGFLSSIVQVGAGGDGADVSGNVAAATLPNGGQGVLVDVVAAVKNVRIADNEAYYGAAVTIIRVGAVVAIGLKILRNYLYNTAAASTVCITFGAAASDGILADNYMGVLNNGTAASQGVTFGAGCLVKAFQNFCSDEPQKSGALAPAAAT